MINFLNVFLLSLMVLFFSFFSFLYFSITHINNQILILTNQNAILLMEIQNLKLLLPTEDKSVPALIINAGETAETFNFFYTGLFFFGAAIILYCIFSNFSGDSVVILKQAAENTSNTMLCIGESNTSILKAIAKTNDCSTDNSQKILNALGEIDSKVGFISNHVDPNIGAQVVACDKFAAILNQIAPSMIG